MYELIKSHKEVWTMDNPKPQDYLLLGKKPSWRKTKTNYSSKNKIKIKNLYRKLSKFSVSNENWFPSEFLYFHKLTLVLTCAHNVPSRIKSCIDKN